MLRCKPGSGWRGRGADGPMLHYPLVRAVAARCSTVEGVTNVPDWVHPVASPFGTFEEED